MQLSTRPKSRSLVGPFTTIPRSAIECRHLVNVDEPRRGCRALHYLFFEDAYLFVVCLKWHNSDVKFSGVIIFYRVDRHVLIFEKYKITKYLFIIMCTMGQDSRRYFICLIGRACTMLFARRCALSEFLAHFFVYVMYACMHSLCINVFKLSFAFKFVVK